MSSPESDTIINAAINQPSSSQLTQSSQCKPIISLKDYLHALDRHKSIDNCFLSPDRLNFFDEITKITNHLFKITAQAEPHTNGDDEAADKQGIQSSVNRVHDMNTQNLNTTQTTAVDNATESNTFKESDGVDVKTVKMCDGSLDSNNNKINDNHEGKNEADEESSARRRPFAEIFKKFSSLADAGADLSNAPWPVSTRRTKFRINQMSSRDVPIFKTEKPAKLQKQNAIDACDTKLFDEQINRKSIFHETSTTAGRNSIVNLLESFEHDRNQLLQSHFRHKTFIDRLPNGSISFDCGQLDVEQRSTSTIRSLFQLHASTGRSVKQIQAKIEAKNKWAEVT